MEDPKKHDSKNIHMYCNTCKNDWISQHGIPTHCIYCGNSDIAPVGEDGGDFRNESRWGERCGE